MWRLKSLIKATLFIDFPLVFHWCSIIYHTFSPSQPYFSRTFKALFPARREAEALPRASSAAVAVSFAKKLQAKAAGRRSTTAPGARGSLPKLPALSERQEEQAGKGSSEG